MDLTAFREKKRVLLVFCPSPKDPRYIRQSQALKKERGAMIDRDIVRLEIFARNGYLDGKEFKDDTPETLRTQFGIEIDDFELRFIGKDGKIKHADRFPIEAKVMYDLTDKKGTRA